MENTGRPNYPYDQLTHGDLLPIPYPLCAFCDQIIEPNHTWTKHSKTSYGTWLYVHLQCSNPTHDPISNPSHYTFSKYQVRDVLDEWNLGEYPNLIIAYLARASHKGNELQDLKKAKWYLDRYINLKEKK